MWLLFLLTLSSRRSPWHLLLIMHGSSTTMPNIEAQVVPDATMPLPPSVLPQPQVQIPPAIPSSASITRLKRQEKDPMPDIDFAIPPEQPWYQGIIFSPIPSCLPLTHIFRGQCHSSKWQRRGRWLRALQKRSQKGVIHATTIKTRSSFREHPISQSQRYFGSRFSYSCFVSLSMQFTRMRTEETATRTATRRMCG
jgi:hypothetical protein